MGESPEAKQLREQIEEQQRIDRARIDEVNAEAQAALDRRENERERAAAAKALRKAAGEEE